MSVPSGDAVASIVCDSSCHRDNYMQRTARGTIMAWWRLRRGSQTVRGSLGRLPDLPGGEEIAVLRLVIEGLDASDLPDESLYRAIPELEEHVPELQREFAELVVEYLGPSFAGGRIAMHEGSIVLLAPVRSVADAIVYYVGTRQTLEWLLRDMRALVNRWLRRYGHAPMRVSSTQVVPRPPLEAAEASVSGKPEATDSLLAYLIASHAVLLLALLATGAVLLAHAI
jgi:hypothetical protein